MLCCLNQTLPHLNVYTLFTNIAYQCICHFYTLGLKTFSHSVLIRQTQNHFSIALRNLFHCIDSKYIGLSKQAILQDGLEELHSAYFNRCNHCIYLRNECPAIISSLCQEFYRVLRNQRCSKYVFGVLFSGIRTKVVVETGTMRKS